MSDRASRQTLTPGSGSAVLIPVKAFELAKGRLRDALDPPAREKLARDLATHVVQVQGETPVAICCDDDGVADWATSVGAQVIWCPDTDLNGAVQQGVREMAAAGYRSVAVAHGDLPRAHSLAALLGWTGVTLVPDLDRRGSNVIFVPTDIDFRFSYGVDSYQRHVAEAVRHNRGLRIVHDDDLAWDIDHPSDLARLQESAIND